MDKIYFADNQIMSLATEAIADEMPKMTKDGTSVSVFGEVTVIVSSFDRKLVAFDSKGKLTSVDYSDRFVHSWRTVPYAITHDSKGNLFMLRDNYKFGTDTGTVARFSSPSGEEETLVAEVIFEQASPFASIVVNGGFVYFTSTEWNRNETEYKWGRSIWRLPTDFTSESRPEEVFNLEEYAPGFYDCRGLTFDADGSLYFTSANVPYEYWKPRPEVASSLGTVVKVNLQTQSATVVKSGLVEPKEVAVVGSNLVVDASDKFTIYTKTGTLVKDVAPADVTSVSVALEEEAVKGKP